MYKYCIGLLLSFGGITDAHSKTAETYFELFLPLLSSIQRRIGAMKKDLLEKQQTNMKIMDSAHGVVLKLSQKVGKIRYKIKIQINKVIESKEDVKSGRNSTCGNDNKGDGPDSKGMMSTKFDDLSDTEEEGNPLPLEEGSTPKPSEREIEAVKDESPVEKDGM
jgi:hypothetical protein